MAVRRCVVLDATDDVAVLLEAAERGDRITVDGRELILLETVPRFHKVALRRVEAGDPVRKAGEVIGVAVRAIEPGEHVHVHNLRSAVTSAG